MKKVYNLTVNNFHTYFVGVSGVLGHNCPDDDTSMDNLTMEEIMAGKKNDPKPKDIVISKWNGNIKQVKDRKRFEVGYGIDKVQEIINHFGGEVNKWHKVKGKIDGIEWHWYELEGSYDIFTKELRAYGKKIPGRDKRDPDWKDW